MMGFLSLLRGRWHWLALAVMMLALAGMAKSRANWKADAQALEAWRGAIVETTSMAAGVEGLLDPSDVSAQISLLGAGLRECRGAVMVQNAAVIASAQAGQAMQRASASGAAAVRKSEGASIDKAARLARVAAAPPPNPVLCKTPADVMEAVR